MNSDLLTVKLEKLTYGGDTLGRLSDGRAVFVPLGLPGETVSIRIENEKRSHVRAELVQVLEPSPQRIEPRCRHYGSCGGCHYQHLSYENQLAAKTELLSDQFRRIGKIELTPVKATVSSSGQWNYRNHVQFRLTEEGELGFNNAHSRTILPVSECHLPEQPLNMLWPKLAFDHNLGLERVSLRLGMDEQAMLVLESDSIALPGLELKSNLSVVHLNGEDLVVMAGDDHLLMSVNDKWFHVSPASFFQINTGMAAKMVAHLLDQLPVTKSTTLLDVYCGVGLFSRFFAPLVGRLIGIESSSSACEDFAINLDEFDNVELYQAAAGIVLPALEVLPDIVIVDPPRAGLEKSALQALQQLSPHRLAYISCDPSTLARDTALLINGGYRLIQVSGFDLFPQTFHIESISIFEKKEFERSISISGISNPY